MRLYPGHCPTSVLGKAVLALDAGARALADPRATRLVGVVGEVTGKRALYRMRARMLADASGRAVLRERPIISAASLDGLSALPTDSFGGTYAAFLGTHGFDPDERSAVQFVDDEELAYVMTRYRQVHDLWHVLFDLPPTLLGEVALKHLEAAQTGLPMAAMGAAAGALRLRSAERALVARHVLPWAARHAASPVDLLSVYYEKEFERPLSEVRAELGVECAPDCLAGAAGGGGDGGDPGVSDVPPSVGSSRT